MIHAHLCEVLRLGEPEELNRNPTWFAPAKAKRRLAEGRTSESSAELARIVDRAIARIESLAGTNEYKFLTSGAITAAYAAEATEASDNAPTLAQPDIIVETAKKGFKGAIKTFGLNAGANVVHATDATLLFSTSMLVARSIHTWIRAHALIAAHKRSVLEGGSPAPAAATQDPVTPGS